MSLLKLLPLKKSEFDPILEARSRIKMLGFDKTALAAYVFGSATTDRFSQESDIDILVVFSDMEAVKLAQRQSSQVSKNLWPVDWVVSVTRQKNQELKSFESAKNTLQN